MTKTEQLFQLFEKWKKKHREESADDFKITGEKFKHIDKGYFCADGIIDENVYDKEPVKVLFLSNESNIDGQKDEKGAYKLWKGVSCRNQNFRNYYNDGRDEWGGRMRERICSLYQTIINDFSLPVHKYANRFAFMNLNKRGGAGSIGNGTHIKHYCYLYKDFINEEISIIHPDLIIWLGLKTFKMNIKKKYLNAKNDNGDWYIEANGKQIPLIGTWHTSYTRMRKNSLVMEEFDDRIISRQAAHLKQLMNECKLLK